MSATISAERVRKHIESGVLAEDIVAALRLALAVLDPGEEEIEAMAFVVARNDQSDERVSVTSVHLATAREALSALASLQTKESK